MHPVLPRRTVPDIRRLRSHPGEARVPSRSPQRPCRPSRRREKESREPTTASSTRSVGRARAREDAVSTSARRPDPAPRRLADPRSKCRSWRTPPIARRCANFRSDTRGATAVGASARHRRENATTTPARCPVSAPSNARVDADAGIREVPFLPHVSARDREHEKPTWAWA
jgi:hypothetical protein